MKWKLIVISLKKFYWNNLKMALRNYKYIHIYIYINIVFFNEFLILRLLIKRK